MDAVIKRLNEVARTGIMEIKGGCGTGWRMRGEDKAKLVLLKYLASGFEGKANKAIGAPWHYY